MKATVRLALPVLAATACVALAGGLAGAAPEAATAPVARAGTAGQAASAGSEPGTLYSAAATSAGNAWAVGVSRFDTSTGTARPGSGGHKAAPRAGSRRWHGRLPAAMIVGCADVPALGR
jgi:hypothetical protein